MLFGHVVLGLGVAVKDFFADAAADFGGPAPVLCFDVRIDARPGQLLVAGQAMKWSLGLFLFVVVFKKR